MQGGAVPLLAWLLGTLCSLLRTASSRARIHLAAKWMTSVDSTHSEPEPWVLAVVRVEVSRY